MKILAVGKNYAAHAKEFDGKVPTEPIIFMKPDSCIVTGNKPFYYPDFSQNIHHEIEIVVKINKICKSVEEKFAHRYYDEITLGVDFTARDMQQRFVKEGLPWTLAKGFDGAAPIGEFIPKTKFIDIQNIGFSLALNDNIQQSGNTKDMVFTIDKIIAYITKFITLKAGDLIFTGTPEGVSAVKIGDNIKGWIENEKILDFDVK